MLGEDRRDNHIRHFSYSAYTLKTILRERIVVVTNPDLEILSGLHVLRELNRLFEVCEQA
jgi:hypothetical protein